MTKNTIVILLVMILSNVVVNAQYSGELILIIKEMNMSIDNKVDKSMELKFSIDETISVVEMESIFHSLEMQPTFTKLLKSENNWKAQTKPGSSKKEVLTIFLNNGFKFIEIEGKKHEILNYLSNN